MSLSCESQALLGLLPGTMSEAALLIPALTLDPRTQPTEWLRWTHILVDILGTGPEGHSALHLDLLKVLVDTGQQVTDRSHPSPRLGQTSLLCPRLPVLISGAYGFHHCSGATRGPWYCPLRGSCASAGEAL